MNFLLAIFYGIICGWRFLCNMDHVDIFNGIPDWYLESLAEGAPTDLLVTMANNELDRREDAAMTPGTPEFDAWVNEDQLY